MGWNPFDRRAKDERAIDDAIAGFEKAAWQNVSSSHASTPFVREALQAWRAAASDAQPAALTPVR